MAKVIRSAKSGSSWTATELTAYKISVTEVPPADFFKPTANPPLDRLDPAILTAPDARYPNLSKATSKYLAYLELAENAPTENYIDDLTSETLKFLDFDEEFTVATHIPIPLIISGEARQAETDVCVVRPRDRLVLVLAEDKTKSNGANAEPQVVAEAVAAFQFNQTLRLAAGKPTLKGMTIPCVTMIGIVPTFYLVPVTAELSNAVASADYPKEVTWVEKCRITADPPVRGPIHDLQFRKLFLQSFLAFKSLAKHHWQKFEA